MFSTNEAVKDMKQLEAVNDLDDSGWGRPWAPWARRAQAEHQKRMTTAKPATKCSITPVFTVTSVEQNQKQMTGAKHGTKCSFTPVITVGFIEPVVDTASRTCFHCETTFHSRNALFRHISSNSCKLIEQDAQGKPDEASRTCLNCQAIFWSRNALFRHIHAESCKDRKDIPRGRGQRRRRTGNKATARAQGPQDVNKGPYLSPARPEPSRRLWQPLN
jgi:hypothetical protein